jgi:DoxX-like family
MFLALSLLLALACLGPAGAKLAATPAVRESAANFGIPWNRYRLISVPELAAGIGVLAGLRIHALGVAAACGMALLLLAALIAHRKAGDSIAATAPALAAVVATAAYLAVALSR